jgi:hypothetical protein
MANQLVVKYYKGSSYDHFKRDTYRVARVVRSDVDAKLEKSIPQLICEQEGLPLAASAQYQFWFYNSKAGGWERAEEGSSWENAHEIKVQYEDAPGEMAWTATWTWRMFDSLERM